jgi:hypothetical protein
MSLNALSPTLTEPWRKGLVIDFSQADFYNFYP